MSSRVLFLFISPPQSRPPGPARSLQVPDDQRLIARARQKHVGVLEGCSEGLIIKFALASTNLSVPPPKKGGRNLGKLTVTQPLCPLFRQRKKRGAPLASRRRAESSIVARWTPEKKKGKETPPTFKGPAQ